MSLDKRRAESNSNHGIVCDCRGVTLVLDTTNCTLVPQLVLITRYTTAANACTDASQNPQRVTEIKDPSTW